MEVRDRRIVDESFGWCQSVNLRFDFEAIGPHAHVVRPHTDRLRAESSKGQNFAGDEFVPFRAKHFVEQAIRQPLGMSFAPY
jgi:hypothetical protein